MRRNKPPCEKCLEARRRLRRFAYGFAGIDLPTHYCVTFADGNSVHITIETNVVSWGTLATKALWGRKLHITVTKKLIDLATGRVVNGFGTVTKVTKIN